MKLKHEDGWLKVDLDERGSNYMLVAEYTREDFEAVESSCGLMMATELHELITCMDDNALFIDIME